MFVPLMLFIHMYTANCNIKLTLRVAISLSKMAPDVFANSFLKQQFLDLSEKKEKKRKNFLVLQTLWLLFRCPLNVSNLGLYLGYCTFSWVSILVFIYHFTYFTYTITFSNITSFTLFKMMTSKYTFHNRFHIDI